MPERAWTDLGPTPMPRDDLSIEEMIAASRKFKHRRLPIYDETPDTIVGILDTRALLLDQFWEGWFEYAQAQACVAVITSYAMMDAPLLARLHAAGLRGMVYTVNDPAEAQRQLALGTDGIVTDAVDRFSPFI